MRCSCSRPRWLSSRAVSRWPSRFHWPTRCELRRIAGCVCPRPRRIERTLGRERSRRGRRLLHRCFDPRPRRFGREVGARFRCGSRPRCRAGLRNDRGPHDRASRRLRARGRDTGRAQGPRSRPPYLTRAWIVDDRGERHVLVAHGGRDKRVPIEHSRMLVDAAATTSHLRPISSCSSRRSSTFCNAIQPSKRVESAWLARTFRMASRRGLGHASRDPGLARKRDLSSPREKRAGASLSGQNLK